MKKVIAEYVWIDNEGGLRSKARVVSLLPYTDHMDIKWYKEWNFDGSSTKQAEGFDSEVIIKPKFICKCPFRKDQNVILLCDTYDANDKPLVSNTRYNANLIFEQKKEQEPWYGLEQEFFMYDMRTNKPLGFNNEIYLNPSIQGQYYCGVGAGNAFGRHVIEKALKKMLYANLSVSGINAEVAPGQWEYQIGPVEGIEASDQLWVSRYIMERVAEKYNVRIEYHPKPLGKDSDWNGSGFHTNYSTKDMREENGINAIHNAIEKLSPKHKEHMEVYGKYNDQRMSGKHETASYDKFTYGRADRGASIRIGNDVYKSGCGYFEDRRPASNADPYLVTSIIFKTTCLE